MRIYPGWIKTTLKEDREYYRALQDALLRGTNEHQHDILSLVKHYHLDQNNDLRTTLYEQFLAVLKELGVTPPNVKINQVDETAGTWYPIPTPGKLFNKQTIETRLAKRQAARQKAWSAELDDHGLQHANVKLQLARPEEPLGEIRNELIIEIVETEEHFDQKIKELQNQIDKQQVQIDELFAQLKTPELS